MCDLIDDWWSIVEYACYKNGLALRQFDTYPTRHSNNCDNRQGNDVKIYRCSQIWWCNSYTGRSCFKYNSIRSEIRIRHQSIREIKMKTHFKWIHSHGMLKANYNTIWGTLFSEQWLKILYHAFDDFSADDSFYYNYLHNQKYPVPKRMPGALGLVFVTTRKTVLTLIVI